VAAQERVKHGIISCDYIFFSLPNFSPRRNIAIAK
jgi:hypothetical protein